MPNKKDAMTSHYQDRKYNAPPSECTVPDRSCRWITQDSIFCHLEGQVVQTGIAIVHWVRCINAIKCYHLMLSPVAVNHPTCHIYTAYSFPQLTLVMYVPQTELVPQYSLFVYLSTFFLVLMMHLSTVYLYYICFRSIYHVIKEILYFFTSLHKYFASICICHSTLFTW